MSATDQGIELRVVRVLADKNGALHTWRRRIWWGSGCTKVLPGILPRSLYCLRRGSRYGTVCPRAGRYRSVPDADGGCVYSRILPRSPRSGAIFRTSSVGTSDWRAAGYPDRSDREVHIGRETGGNQNSAGPRPDAGGIGTELCSLSSMGFDQDGAFHIQLRLADGVGGEYGYLQTGMPQVEWEVAPLGDPHHIPVGRNIVLRYPVPYADGGAFRPVPH